MDVMFDLSEIEGFVQAMAQAPELTRQELIQATDAANATGVGLAQEFAPVDMGDLSANIRPIENASFIGGGVTAMYGTDLIYSRMREYGGTITPKSGEFLVFRGRDGNLVFARSVTQTGTRYMGRSADALRPQLEPIYSAAIARVLAQIGGG